MSNQRSQTPRYNNYQRHSTITEAPKPPRGNRKWSVPAWEKKFCFEVGSAPWWKVVEAKRTTYLYDRVLQWDSSAGEETFKNAKSRYWANINGFTSDVALPDPDVYIDDVDWDAEVDAELILDLERGWEPVKGEEDECVVILDASVLFGQDMGIGWGTGWGDAEEVVVGTGKPENPWEDKKCGGLNEVGYGKPEHSWGGKKCDGWNKEIVKTKPVNPWEVKKCDGWNEEIVKTKPVNPWEVKKCDGWNDGSWGRKEKTGTWAYKNNNNGFKVEYWGHKNRNNNNGFKDEYWGHKNRNNNNGFKVEYWGHKNRNNNNGFKVEYWGHKNRNNNNRFNHKKIENWNGKDQGKVWRKKGEVPRGGDREEDCGWRNGGGRTKGGFQQHSNGWGWTKSF